MLQATERECKMREQLQLDAQDHLMAAELVVMSRSLVEDMGECRQLVGFREVSRMLPAILYSYQPYATPT